MTNYNNVNINDFIDSKIENLLEKQNKLKTILILSGGGQKGCAHIGALKALEELNILKNINTIACCSIGSLISVLHVIGYTPDNIKELILLFDFKKLRKIDPMNFFNTFGFDNGEKFDVFLNKLFNAKHISPNITFKELYEFNPIKVILTTVCLNNKSVYYLSYLTHPNLKIITGIKMSCAVPFWFIPIKYKNKLFIDGGVMDNYPIQLFKDELEHVIGVCLLNNENFNEITNIESFIINIISCIGQGVSQNSYKGYEKYTIKVSLSNINIINLNIGIDEKKKMIKIGYDNTIKYFISMK